MKRTILALGLIVTLVLGSTGIVCAESGMTPTATFDGSEEIKYNYDTANFGNEFANMLPGESREQSVLLTNATDREVQFYMSGSVIKAFEDTREASGGAYQIKLTVSQGSTETVIYGDTQGEGGEVGGLDREGLKDWNGDVNDWFMAAALKGGTQAEVTLQVSIDGESHDNSYQAAAGTFQFQFRAGYDDSVTRIEKKGSNIVKEIVKTVKTGDETPIFVLIAAFTFASAAIILILAKKRKRGLWL